MKNDRGALLRRVVALMRDLQGRQYAPPLDALARRYGVHKRTIRRDLEALEDAGLIRARWRHIDA